MSKRSQRRLSRSQNKRRRQLRERDLRIESREEESSQSQQFAAEPFILKHIIEILFVVLAIFGFLIFRSLAPNEGDTEKTRETVDTLLLNRSYDWELKYPYGYKIIALTDKEIIHTSYDTLPLELKINWNKIIISRIKANQLADKEEMIKIEIADIHYAPENVSGMSIATSLSRHKGAKTRLAQFGKLDFMIEIIEDTQDHLFCMLGLRMK